MLAQTLESAIAILNPESALSDRAEIESYFVARPNSPLKKLELLIKGTNEPEKFLFTGHRGNGKSTELAKLQLLLQESKEPFFFIVRYSVKQVLSLYDLTYVDVLLSLGLQLFEEVTRQNMAVNQAVLVNILNFTKDISKEIQVSGTFGAEVGGELNVYAAKLSNKYKLEHQTRLAMRETVSKRIDDLLHNIDLLIREVERVTKRRTLVIIEDLDKADLGVAKKLFYDYANSLLSPRVSVIYTFPIALRHDNDFIQVTSSFPNMEILPNFKPNKRNGDPDEKGRECLKNILTRRVDASLIEPDALEELVTASGGIPRELIVSARQSCLEGATSDKTVIDVPTARAALMRRRRDFESLLDTSQRQLLAKIHATKSIENDEAHRKLLHNLSALEYRNDTVWYDVHAVVQPFLPALVEDAQ
jgi:energy-coupling factor transporter ATP-binding protein EcfA2